MRHDRNPSLDREIRGLRRAVRLRAGPVLDNQVPGIRSRKVQVETLENRVSSEADFLP